MRSDDSAPICVRTSPVSKPGRNRVRRKYPANDEVTPVAPAVARRSVRAMSDKDPEFIPVREAAERLGVPMSFLRAEALAGRIPFLRAGGRMLFDLQSTHRAIVERVAHVAQETPP